MQIDPISKLGRELKFSISTRNRTRYFGPSYNCYVIPEKNSEIFVGRLPPKSFEDKIYPFFAKAGKIYRIKLMLKMDGGNKGYCFVKFEKEEEASNAVATLRGVEFPGAPNGLYITRSTDHRTLMVTGAQVSLEKVCQDIQMRVDGHFNATAVLGDSTVYLLEFQEHDQAIVTLKMFGSRTDSYWGPSSVLDWQPNEQVLQRKIEKRMHSQSMIRLSDELNITIPDNNMSVGTGDSRLSLDSGLGSSSSTGSLQLQAHAAPPRFEPLLGHTKNNFLINEPTTSSFQLQTHSVPPGFKPLPGYSNNNFVTNKPTNEGLSGNGLEGLEIDLTCDFVPVTGYRNTSFQVYTQMVVSDNVEERNDGAVIHTFLKKILISELEWFQQNEQYLMETPKPPTQVHVIDDHTFKLLMQREYKRLSLLTDAANVKRTAIIFKFLKKIVEVKIGKRLYQR